MRKSIDFVPSETATICDVFRQRLRITMMHDDVNYTELANKIGMLAPNLTRTINGRNISLQFATKVAKALDISLDWLCGLEENECD